AGMQYAGLDFAISSWWGQGSREDQAVAAELAAATDGFKWSLYYEPEGTGNPTVSQLQSDLAYIAARYAGSPVGAGQRGPVLPRAQGVRRLPHLCRPARLVASVRSRGGHRLAAGLLLQ